MTEPADGAPTPLLRWIKTAAITILLVFTAGVIFGFLASHIQEGEAFRAIDVAILGGLVLAVGGLGWLLVRVLRAGKAEGPLNPRERLNRNLINLSGLIGLMAGVLVMVSQGIGPETQPLDIFSDRPLPPAIALILVAGIGIVVPAISYFWHRDAIDELEADAYKTGALYGLYVFMIGAPLWWFAWRGGFVPEPDGVLIYLAVTTVVGVTWILKKYR